MRRLVGVLRRPEESPALAPQPSLEHLDKLVQQAREAGLPVALRIEGDPVPLAAGLDLTAYRLVQEGLTNALKHARAEHAEVLVRYQDGHVELTVSDDGSGDGGGDSGGHGLVGMRERVSVYGGELEAGALPRGRLSAACETPGRMTGTYTFLLTDIEGSTSLVRQLREQYGDVLAEHHRVLRGIFEEAGGEGIGTQGDAFFVAFRRPKDAVAAALAGQQALVGHEWPHDVQPRVRMGIHTGEASISADEYHGLAVHRAARICAAGQGGQILVSQATHSLLEDEELAFLDLGEQQLKDFERPVRIYELDVVGRGERGGKSRAASGSSSWTTRPSSARASA